MTRRYTRFSAPRAPSLSTPTDASTDAGAGPPPAETIGGRKRTRRGTGLVPGDPSYVSNTSLRGDDRDGLEDRSTGGFQSRG